MLITAEFEKFTVFAPQNAGAPQNVGPTIIPPSGRILLKHYWLFVSFCSLMLCKIIFRENIHLLRKSEKESEKLFKIYSSIFAKISQKTYTWLSLYNLTLQNVCSYKLQNRFLAMILIEMHGNCFFRPVRVIFESMFHPYWLQCVFIGQTFQ